MQLKDSSTKLKDIPASIYKKSHYFDIFNQGREAFDYSITTSSNWISLSRSEGRCATDTRIVVDIDYDVLSKEKQGERHQGELIVEGAGRTEKIDVFVFTPKNLDERSLAGLFVEDNGCIAIYAENFHRTKDGKGFGWQITQDLGVTGASVGAYPFTAIPVEHEWKLQKEGASAEYDFYCFNTGWVDILSYSLPTFPLTSQRHCLYGISIDEGPPLIVDFETQLRSEKWKQNVQRNQSVDRTKHSIPNAGKHTLKLWMIDSGVFLDKFVIDFGGLKDSYMGPEETVFQ